jgi:hypothetical protein
MELLDRYLFAVSKHLPWQRQDDIIAELRANLEAQLEDKEAELGRPLTQDEAAEWLRHVGTPAQMAATYQPQRYLVGPRVFPTYLYVLRTACFWAAVAVMISFAVKIFNGRISGSGDIVEVLVQLPQVLLMTAAWVTLAFAGIEYFGVTNPRYTGLGATRGSWNPASLPPVEKTAATGERHKSYGRAAAEVSVGFVLLGWLLLIPWYPVVILGPGAAYASASHFALAPVWLEFLWCIVALNAVQLTWRAIDLFRGTWRKPRPVRHLVVKAMGMFALGIVLATHDHAVVLLKDPAGDLAQYGAKLDAINLYAYRSLQLVLAIALLQFGWDAIKLGAGYYRRRAIEAR